jgi:paired amphipathic helix protein Sin3a
VLIAAVFAELYGHFVTALSALMEGTMDSTKYEDECRSLMGTGSYQLFTMDKLVSQTVRQLVSLACDPTASRLRVRGERPAAV